MEFDENYQALRQLLESMWASGASNDIIDKVLSNHCSDLLTYKICSSKTLIAALVKLAVYAHE